MNRNDHELAAHHSWLRRTARRFARSNALADDLIQDTYVTALRNAPPEGQLRPWLRAVMRKLAWGEQRSELRRIQREEGFSLTAPTLTLPEPLLDQGFNRERLTEALASLPEPFHSTIVQRFFKGRSCADIARSENVPAGTVRWRQARAIELLRAELAPPRRGRMIWALPFLGAGHRLVTQVWQTLVRTSGSKAFWVWLALAAAIYVIRGSAVSPQDPSAAASVARIRGRDAVVLANPSRGVARRFGAAGADDHRSVVTSGSAQTTGPLAAQTEAVTPAAVQHPEAEPLPISLDAALDIHRDDCQWDPVNGWRCPGAVSGAASSVAAQCALVHRQILEAEALALASPTASRFLTAALQANRALALQLKCPSLRAGGLEGFAGGGARSGGGVDDSGKPGCVTQAGTDGTPCTVCPGEAPVCAPAGCHAQVSTDGAVCTTCVGAHGEIHTDCPEEPVSVCQSEISDAGLVCSTCDNRPGESECLPAQCGVSDHCLRCVDPKGRVALDCSIDYEKVYTSGYSYGGGLDGDSFFSVCSYMSGVPKVSGTTCHYPGLKTCVESGGEGWHCIECTYPDGSGSGSCTLVSEPLLDPLADRPAYLPAPGTCTVERGADGAVTCAACTHEDLSATRSCR